MEDKILLSEEKKVFRREDAVLRPMEVWTPGVHSLLRHFHKRSLPVPRIMESDIKNYEAVEYIEGQQVHPYKWTDEGLYEVGRLTARLHEASMSFVSGENLVWKPWYLRELGVPSVYSHGDIAPWNIITQGGIPTALIDWECAGPIDPLVELARVCWLFPQLHDDDLAQLYDLPSPELRAKQVRLIADAYGLTSGQRQGFIDKIIEVVICETAHEAIDTGVVPGSVGNLWGFAWRTRSLYWIWRHKDILKKALD